MVNIVKTPYSVPALEDLCYDPKIPQQLDELVRINSSGIVLLSGTNPIRVSTFTYEVGIDTPTFEDGLRDVAYVNPDLLYVSYKEVLPAEDIFHIVRAVELSTLVVFYCPYMSEEMQLKSFEKHKRLIRELIKVEPSQEGKLQVYITDRLP